MSNSALAENIVGCCNKYMLRIPSSAGCWWLIPEILAAWEAEIRRIMV
jgi:hypothetical protein